MVRRRFRSDGRWSLVTLVVTGLGLWAWHAACAGRWPSAGIESPEGERMLWVEGAETPIGVSGDLARADVLVVGDSRVGHDVHLAIASSLGVGKVALVWLHGTRLAPLLEPLLSLEPPRSVVVSLTPLGLVGYPQNPSIAETLRHRCPASDPASTPRAVQQWAIAEQAHLEGLGFDAKLAAQTVRWWTDIHRRTRSEWRRARRWVDTEGIDLRLAHRVDRWRSILLDPIEPMGWHRAWRKDVRPRASDAVYRAMVAPAQANALQVGAQRVRELLGALQARGWRVACTRLPLDPGLREVEDATGCGALLASIAADAGVPYMDFGGWPNSTMDGSHLHWRGGDRLTRALVAWLREDLGWRARR